MGPGRVVVVIEDGAATPSTLLLLRSSSPPLRTRIEEPFRCIWRLEEADVRGAPHSILAPPVAAVVRDDEEESEARCCEEPACCSPSSSRYTSSSSKLDDSLERTAQLYPPLALLLDLIPPRPENDDRLARFVSEGSGLISSLDSLSRHIRPAEDETGSGDRLWENSPNMGSVNVISLTASSLNLGDDSGCLV
jgi:hypothetical protein